MKMQIKPNFFSLQPSEKKDLLILYLSSISPKEREDIFFNFSLPKKKRTEHDNLLSQVEIEFISEILKK
jgi:P pilus assembly chaperone PapD